MQEKEIQDISSFWPKKQNSAVFYWDEDWRVGMRTLLVGVEIKSFAFGYIEFGKATRPPSGDIKSSFGYTYLELWESMSKEYLNQVRSLQEWCWIKRKGQQTEL